MDVAHTRVFLAHRGHVVELAIRSLMRASPTAPSPVRELELLEIRGVSHHRPGLVLPDSSRARAPSSR